MAWLGDKLGGFLDRVKKKWVAPVQSRRGAKKSVGESLMARLIGPGTGWGWPGGWTQDRFEQVQHYRNWVFVAVRARAQEHASIRPCVAYVRPHKRRGRKDFITWQKSLYAVQPHEEIFPVDADHPLWRLLNRPNDWDTAGQLWYELSMFGDLTGNGYLWGPPNLFGLPAELWVLPSHWVQARVGRGKLVSHYEVRPWVGAGCFDVPAEEIIHFRTKSPLHKVDGWSAQQAGDNWIDVGEQIEKSRFWTFMNGVFPLGNLKLGENFGDPDEDELERIYAKFFARLQGVQMTGRPIITPPGAEYVPLSIAPDQMGYGVSADQIRDNVLALFQVPKEVAGIAPAGSDLSWYAPMQQFCRFAIVPGVRDRGEVLTKDLAPRYDVTIRIWWNDPTPNNPNQLNQDLGLDLAHGVRTINEARAQRGLPPARVPEADMLMVQQGDRKSVV